MSDFGCSISDVFILDMLISKLSDIEVPNPKSNIRHPK
jgi:hypothetical protein